jgi:hypothetical protein
MNPFTLKLRRQVVDYINKHVADTNTLIEVARVIDFDPPAKEYIYDGNTVVTVRGGLVIFDGGRLPLTKIDTDKLEPVDPVF